MGTSADSSETRRRLIDAAGHLFADRGFHAVGVREIVARAGTNLNAINYHFKDKAGLYRAVLEEALACGSFTEFCWNGRGKQNPVEALRQAIRSILADSINFPEASWQVRLLRREAHEPTDNFQPLLDKLLKPQLTLFSDILAAIAGIDAKDPRLQLLGLGLCGQIEMLVEAEPFIRPLMPELHQKTRSNDWLIDELVASTVDSLKSIKRRNSR